MKTSSVFTTLRAGVFFLLAATGAFGADVIKDPLALKVQVNIPPTWNPLVTDRLADDVVDGVRQILTHRGYPRTVESMDFVEKPGQAPYLLTINLLEWRMKRTGHIDCTLTATLQTPRGTRELGLYNYTSVHFLGSGRWLLEREFDEAASGALQKLCDAIVRSELIPDLAERLS
jgi:hypothetical protein